MDILVVSNIFNKFSKIFLDNNKTQIDIDILSEFLEDPFNLDLEHLNYFYLQCGGSDAAGAAASEATAAAKEATGGEGEAKEGEGEAKEGDTKEGEAAEGDAKEGDGDEEGGGEDDEEEEEEEHQEKQKTGRIEGMKNYFSDIAKEVGDHDPGTESSLLKMLNFLVKCLLYPLLFIFLIIFPYIYVTYTSFKKLLKSYRKNVLTV